MRPTVGLVFTASLMLAIQRPLSASARVQQIRISDYYFAPAGTALAPGDTVRWVLESGTHTTTSDPTSQKSWDSGPMSRPGDSFDVVFTPSDGPGPFPYHCSIHPGSMVDTIFVLDTCRATGMIHGTGKMTVADIVFAIRVITGEEADFDALYLFDLNGDCHIDGYDYDLLACYMDSGLACFPVYPVPTCCFPTLLPSTCNVSITGDVDLSQSLSSSDIIALVKYVFKAGTPPLPCEAAGDVNCSGAVSSTDIVALVSAIFKGGPSPCDVCTIIPARWECPQGRPGS